MNVSGVVQQTEVLLRFKQTDNKNCVCANNSYAWINIELILLFLLFGSERMSGLENKREREMGTEMLRRLVYAESIFVWHKS
jgi:hypothetical protein